MSIDYKRTKKEGRKNAFKKNEELQKRSENTILV